MLRHEAGEGGHVETGPTTHTVAKLRVLVVDDDEADFYMVSRMLRRAERSDLRLTHIDNFDEAVAAILGGGYDLVLLDYFIGVRSGIEVVREISRHGVNVPIVMLTGSDSRRTSEEALRAGVNDFLDKSEISPVLLTRTIDFALRRFSVERQLRESEARLRIAREEAEAANRSKSEFMAQMSHELRTPLNAIIGFSQIIKDDVLNIGVEQTYREYASGILMSGEHLLKLINDLLDIAKIEAGKFDITPELLDTNAVFAAMNVLTQPLCDEQNVTLTVNLSDAPAFIYADERALKQVLLNIISNALKFSREGETVSVTVREQGQRTVIRVADSGVGIPREKLDTVMLPFVQSGVRPDIQIKGTGLGLPISKLLTERHGGTIEIDSILGEGTTVELRFPHVALSTLKV